jgi:carbon starvation protein
MRFFTVILMVLVGAVFITGPADILQSMTGIGKPIIFAVIVLYYLLATVLPIDKLIGRIYPIFGAALLFMGLGILGGIIVKGYTLPELTLHNLHPQGRSIFPFLFITIACGAISGFHSLVASGTSVKQLSQEPDTLFVGYGSMLVEGALAVLVILCIAAGLSLGVDGMDGHEAWRHFYSAWMGEKGLGDNLAPVIGGAANVMGSLGIPKTLGFAIMGVFIASFAGTTLDTAVRIQRYVIGELAEDCGLPALSGRWTATTLAVLSAAALAFISTNHGTITFGADAAGAKRLWPLFGTVNQLLAALALLVVTMYLKRKGGWRYLTTAIPCLLMIALTGWAMVLNEIGYIQTQNLLLSIVGGLVLALAGWMTAETVIVFFTSRQQ